MVLCTLLCQIPTALSQTLFVKTLADGKYEYTLSDAGACITRYTGNAGKIELPDKLGGFSVVAIGDLAFAKAKAVRRIIVPDTVISISPTAFAAKKKITLVGTPGSYLEKFVSEYEGTAKLKFVSRHALTRLNIGGNITLRTGETRKLQITLTPADADPVFITYMSSDPEVAIVAQDGTATALKAGKARVKATNVNGVSSQITVTVKGEADPPITVPVSDGMFFNSGKNLNRTIAAQASRLALAADAKNMILALVKNCGFTLKTIKNYDDPAKGDYVAYTISTREITSNGQKATLYLLTLRGTQDLQEWLSNLYIGTTGTHLGFSNACDEVEKALKNALKNEKGPFKLYIAGHSRGSAVGNLLCARLLKSGIIKPDDLFAYLFAPPAVSTAIDASLPIHNFYNEDDIVPRIPLDIWGYKINGEHNALKRSDAIFNDVANMYYMLTKSEYNPVPRSWWDTILNKLGKACPTTKEYDAVYKLILHKYRPRIGMIFKYAQNRQFIRMFREIVRLINDVFSNNASELQTQGVDTSVFADFGGDINPSDFGIYNPTSAHEMPIYVAWMTVADK